jgi:hypothetical protein
VRASYIHVLYYIGAYFDFASRHAPTFAAWHLVQDFPPRNNSAALSQIKAARAARNKIFSILPFDAVIECISNSRFGRAFCAAEQLACGAFSETLRDFDEKASSLI